MAAAAEDVPLPDSSNKEDEARIAELRAKYLAGAYQMNAAALSAKIVDEALEISTLEAEFDSLRKR